MAILGLALFLLLRRGERPGTHVSSTTAPGAGAPVAARPAGAPDALAASVAGKVTDGAGAPLAGAVVRFAPREQRPGAAAPAIARGGADGTFRIADLPPGRWRASATAPGYVPGHIDSVELVAGREASVAFRLEAGGRMVTGTVTDRSGGPIAGALIEASPIHGILSTRDPRAAAALTDAAGKYAIPVGQGRHRLQATHPEYVGDVRVAEVGTAGAVVNFTLMPGGVIEGIVREHRTGTPVPGAQVIHVREAMAGLPFGQRMAVTAGRGTVTADGEGRFRIVGLSPGAIRLTARAKGMATREPTVVPLGVAGQLTGVEVFVGGAFAIRGTVTVAVEGGGGPAAAADVSAEREGNAAGTVADAAGKFALEGLPPGNYALSAGGPDMLEAERPVRVTVRDRDVEGVKLTVRRGATISGRVEPAAVAEVGIRHDLDVPAGGRMLRIERGASTLTAPDGTFVLGPVAPGTVVLAARAADGRRGVAEVSVPPAGATGVVIHLETRGGLSGRVVTTGGKPMAGVSVHARRVEEGQSVTMIVNGLDVGAERAPTGEGGRWEILGLAPGSYELTVHDEAGDAFLPAGGAAPPQVSLGENERKDGIELTVEVNDGVIRGTVLAPDGKPLGDAWVTASASMELPQPRPGGGARVMTATIVTSDDASIGAGPAPVLTDASGRFEISGLRRGKYRLQGEGLSGAARGLLDGVPTGSDVTLPLSSLARLEGRVTADGKPVDEFTVELSGAVGRTETYQGAGGAFVMQRVDPGHYTVRATAPEGSGQVDVDVTTAPATQVAIALSSFGKVVGRVVGADGAPLAGAPVIAGVVGEGGSVRVAIEGQPPTTGDDGSFAVDVGRGKHMLIVVGKAGPVVRKPIDVVSGQVLDVGTLKAEPPAPPRQPAPQKLRQAARL
ncbi:MAG TPA: carboxypeptidase-like regulatory domain-containing protein [Haliangiales bacterium]|nr:carboxypeptidase-like regulatory domain-containing protein [Haliangiales bacterium]